MELPETHAPHHHKTGRHWLDAVLAFCAFGVSLISLYVAIHHGRVMKEMADANARMVTATSWPYVEFGTGNATEGRQMITLSLTNQGVGPARIRAMELRYRGQPVEWSRDLFTRCCGGGGQKFSFSTSTANGRVIKAGESIDFLRIERQAGVETIWDRFDDERFNIGVRLCYCSVFDDCWVSESLDAYNAIERPQRVGVGVQNREKVDSCPTDWQQYRE